MILILDDHPLSRQGISSLVRSWHANEEICEAGTVQEAVQILQKEPASLAFIDINLGRKGESGFNLLQWLKDKQQDTKTFVITSSSRRCDFKHAQELGVDAYVLKDAFIDEITYGLRAVERGGKFYSASIMDRLAKEESDEKAIATLTQRELDVLSLIGSGETNDGIAQMLYISKGTVKKHVTSILSKLALLSRVEAVIFANKNSYIIKNAIAQAFREDERRGL